MWVKALSSEWSNISAKWVKIQAKVKLIDMISNQFLKNGFEIESK